MHQRTGNRTIGFVRGFGKMGKPATAQAKVTEGRPPLPPRTRDRKTRTVYARGQCAVMAMDSHCKLRIVCVTCGTRATFGYGPPCPRKKKCGYTLHCGPRWCQEHAPPGTYDIANMPKECSESGCRSQRVFGSTCRRHSEKGRARAEFVKEKLEKTILRQMIARHDALMDVEDEARKVYCRLCDDDPATVP
jgi:hypothetical protein